MCRLLICRYRCVVVDRLVPQQQLDLPDVGAHRQHVRGEGMTKHVRRHMLAQTGFMKCFTNARAT